MARRFARIASFNVQLVWIVRQSVSATFDDVAVMSTTPCPKPGFPLWTRQGGCAICAFASRDRHAACLQPCRCRADRPWPSPTGAKTDGQDWRPQGRRALRRAARLPLKALLRIWYQVVKGHEAAIRRVAVQAPSACRRDGSRFRSALKEAPGFREDQHDCGEIRTVQGVALLQLPFAMQVNPGRPEPAESRS